MARPKPTPSHPPPVEERWTLPGLVLLALALRLYGIQAGLPEVYEEAYPFKVAWTMWGWGPGRGLDLDPHWFKYPGLMIDLQFLGQGLLYLVLSAAGVVHSALDFRILEQLDKTSFYLMARAITALLGAATVLPVFHLTRHAAGRGAAIAAALLVAINPLLIAKSQLVEVDVPLAFMVALGLKADLDLAGGLTRGRALTAGALVGLAATTKYPGLVLVVPWLVAVACGARAARRSPLRPRPGEVAISWPWAIAAGGAALLVTAFVTSPFLFLDHRSALADLAVESEHMRRGHFGSDLGPAWLSYLVDWVTVVAGWPVALAALAGLVVFGARRSPWAMVTGSFVLAYAALVSSFAMKADRYLLPLLPVGILFACALVGEAFSRLHAARSPGRAPLTLAAATLVLALPALIAFPAHVARLRPDTRTVAKAWFEANVRPGAYVASEPYGPPLIGPLDLQALDRDLVAALQQRGYQPKLYAVVSVPMFQVGPERSAPFYDPALYRVADAFIVTGAARDRYRKEPERFAAQLALYDTLASAWELWREFPSRGGPGPDIIVYRNREQERPFAERRPLPGPTPVLREGPPVGGEAYFYYNVGLNYELFGFAGQALRSYLEGMRFAATEPPSATGCAERAAGLLVRAGRPQEAAELLERAARASIRPADATRLRALGARLTTGVR
jgi:dolichyl-phosphate-mannose-protein mannosyltransferase